jgi:Fusaric acid resistance protein-like
MSQNDASDRAARAVFHGILLAALCVISYQLITHLLPRVFSVSHDDDLLGGMWAIAATIFVYRYSYEETIGAALSRMSATLLSFVLCFLYLLFLPPNVWGTATLIGVGAILMSWLKRPDDVITPGITTAVVMVVAAISPHHAWMQPILRVVDTLVGTAIGVVGALMTPKAALRTTFNDVAVLSKSKPFGPGTAENTRNA